LNNNLPYSDKELFSLISKGDDGAFTEIYLRYAEKLYPHISKLLNADLWVEEILQDVFTKLWQIRDSLSHVENPSAYLYRMAGNRTLDHIKRRAIEVKMQYHVVQQAEHFLYASAPEQDGRLREIKQAVQQLTPQKQLIFRLKHEEGLSYEEIAGQLQLSKNTVRNHLATTLEFIRNQLLKKGVFMVVFILSLYHLLKKS